MKRTVDVGAQGMVKSPGTEDSPCAPTVGRRYFSDVINQAGYLQRCGSRAEHRRGITWKAGVGSWRRNAGWSAVRRKARDHPWRMRRKVRIARTPPSLLTLQLFRRYLQYSFYEIKANLDLANQNRQMHYLYLCMYCKKCLYPYRQHPQADYKLEDIGNRQCISPSIQNKMMFVWDSTA